MWCYMPGSHKTNVHYSTHIKKLLLETKVKWPYDQGGLIMNLFEIDMVTTLLMHLQKF